MKPEATMNSDEETFVFVVMKTYLLTNGERGTTLADRAFEDELSAYYWALSKTNALIERQAQGRDVATVLFWVDTVGVGDPY